MGGMSGDGNLVCSLLLHSGGRDLVVVELAVQVWREDCMNGPAVAMPCLSVVMVGFRMHMEQWDGQHPDNDPGSHHDVQPRSVFSQHSHAGTPYKTKPNTRHRMHQGTAVSRGRHRGMGLQINIPFDTQDGISGGLGRGVGSVGISQLL